MRLSGLNRNKKRGLLILVLVFVVGIYVFSQQRGSRGANSGGSSSDSDKDRINYIVDDESVITKDLIGPDAGKDFYKVIIDTFEESDDWYGRMPNDQGIVVTRKRPGGPLALKESPAEVKTTKERVKKNPPKYRTKTGEYKSNYYPAYKDDKKYVLGTRVDFQRRGHNWFALYPDKPIKLSGLVKGFEVWVAGRQREHMLSVMVEDAYGENRLIPLGKLNFQGWKRLAVNVPDQIKQYDYIFAQERGLTFKGFLVTCNPMQSWGKYYMYMDNFGAEISRFWEENADESDPLDIW